MNKAAYCGLSFRVISIVVVLFYPQVSQSNSSQNKIPFKGFHIGGNLGYETGYSHERFNTTAGGAAISASEKSGFDGIDGGINLGYTYVFSRVPLAFGLEGLANWSNVKVSRKFSATAGGVAANFTASERMNQSFQFVGRMGYVIGQAMPFVKFGWDNSSWKLNSTINVTPGPIVLSNNKSKRINGVAYGAGIDVALTKHILAGLEYTRVDFKKQTVNLGIGNTTASYEPHTNKFAAVVKYIFH